MIETLLQDLRYALRTFAKNPAFTAVALVILTLGIGATTAIFSVVDAVLLESLPYQEPERLVRVGHAHIEHGLDGIGEGGGFSPQDFADLVEGSASYERLATYSFVPGNSTANLVGDGTPECLDVAVVSGSFFEVLGRSAAIGRTIGFEDAVEGLSVYPRPHGLACPRRLAGVLGHKVVWGNPGSLQRPPHQVRPPPPHAPVYHPEPVRRSRGRRSSRHVERPAR